MREVYGRWQRLGNRRVQLVLRRRTTTITAANPAATANHGRAAGAWESDSGRSSPETTESVRPGGGTAAPTDSRFRIDLPVVRARASVA